MALKKSPKKVLAAAEAEERKHKANVAAKKQAAKDAMARPEDPKVEVKVGDQVPLHAANIAQRKIDNRMRDEVRDASVAAAKAVQKTLRTAGGSSRGARRMQKVAQQSASG